MTKKWLLPVILLASLGLVVLGVFNVKRQNARAHWAENEEAWKKAMAFEREAALMERRPVLRGNPIDENAAPRYRRIMEAIKPGRAGLTDLAKWIGEGPGKPLPSTAAAILEKWRPQIVEVREAVRCTRLDWGVQFEKGVRAEMPSLLDAQLLPQLLVLEGHRLAQAGNPREAAECYLDAARFGADIASSGPLISYAISISIQLEALDALSRLFVAAKWTESGTLAELAQQLDRCRAGIPSLSDAFRREWLQLMMPEPGIKMGVWDLIEWDEGYPHVKAHFEAQIRAADMEDPKRRRAVLAPAHTAADRLMSGPWALALPAFTPSRRSRDMVLCLVRLLQAGTAIERQRLAAATYPAAVEPVMLPVDPFAWPRRMTYECLGGGRGYRVRSVGEGDRVPLYRVILERKPE